MQRFSHKNLNFYYTCLGPCVYFSFSFNQCITFLSFSVKNRKSKNPMLITATMDKSPVIKYVVRLETIQMVVVMFTNISFLGVLIESSSKDG